MHTEVFLAERKKTERALSEVEQRYQRLLAATTDYIYSVDLTRGSEGFTSHGPGCESVTGYTVDEFSEDPYLWFRIIYEEDRPAVMAHVERIFQEAKPAALEHRIVHKDRRVRWIRNTPIPHRDAQGRLLGYDGLITDVTNRKLAEIALQESQERLALVIRGSTDGIWDWDLATGEVYFGPRWKSMLGYADHELENRFSTWESLLHPEDREGAVAKVESCLASQAPSLHQEFRLRHKNGSYRWILSRAVILRDQQGRAMRMAGSHVDLTERRVAAEKLQQANTKLARRGDILRRTIRQLNASQRELKDAHQRLVQAAKLELAGTLAAGVAHEVKNPLQTLVLGLHLLTTRLSPTERTPEIEMALKDMDDAVRRAKAIIGDLLTLSSPMQFQRQPEDLHGVIERALVLLKNELLKSKVHLVRQFAAELPLVSIDPVRLEQVFINLVLNAIQAMPQGGTITLLTRLVHINGSAHTQSGLFHNCRTGDEVVMAQVQDTGIGVPDALLGRVFDPFFTTKPPGLGTGLGLSMAKKIVDHHGGAIELRNAPTGGVIVTVVLKL